MIAIFGASQSSGDEAGASRSRQRSSLPRRSRGRRIAITTGRAVEASLGLSGESIDRGVRRWSVTRPGAVHVDVATCAGPSVMFATPRRRRAEEAPVWSSANEAWRPPWPQPSWGGASAYRRAGAPQLSALEAIFYRRSARRPGARRALSRDRPPGAGKPRACATDELIAARLADRPGPAWRAGDVPRGASPTSRVGQDPRRSSSGRGTRSPPARRSGCWRSVARAGRCSAARPQCGAKLKAPLAPSRGNRCARVTPFSAELAGAPLPGRATRTRPARGRAPDAMLMGDAMLGACGMARRRVRRRARRCSCSRTCTGATPPTVSFIDAALRHARRPAALRARARAARGPRASSPASGASAACRRSASAELHAQGRGAPGAAGPRRARRRGDRRAASSSRPPATRSTWRSSSAPSPRAAATPLPETVLAMVQARLDALGAEARRVLRAASVFGEVLARRRGSRRSAARARRTSTSWLDELVASAR